MSRTISTCTGKNALTRHVSPLRDSQKFIAFIHRWASTLSIHFQHRSHHNGSNLDGRRSDPNRGQERPGLRSIIRVYSYPLSLVLWYLLKLKGLLSVLEAHDERKSGIGNMLRVIFIPPGARQEERMEASAVRRMSVHRDEATSRSERILRQKEFGSSSIADDITDAESQGNSGHCVILQTVKPVKVGVCYQALDQGSCSVSNGYGKSSTKKGIASSQGASAVAGGVVVDNIRSYTYSKHVTKVEQLAVFLHQCQTGAVTCDVLERFQRGTPTPFLTILKGNGNLRSDVPSHTDFDVDMVVMPVFSWFLGVDIGMCGQ
ncbi:hypothetical protein EDB83DRAFT_2557338 [Lactarius deliciosus]|nr:hypothetical protein EDB83DRAFT_2557338 [Lactarius deliciosus]